ncbi:hypothetical protein ACF0H5_013985 [Mactra antiquata]
MDIFLKCGPLLTILLLHVTLKTVNASVTQWSSHENTFSGTTVSSQNNPEPVGENSVPESETHNKPEPIGENSAPEGGNDPEPTSEDAEPTSETQKEPKPTSETSEVENESEPTGENSETEHESVAVGETPDTETEYDTESWSEPEPETVSENTEPEPETMTDNSPEPTGENAEHEAESETEPMRWNWGIPESEFGNGVPEFVEPPVYPEEKKPPGLIYYYDYFGHGVGEEEAVDEMAVGEEENISPEDFQGTAELSEPESESWDSDHLREYLQNEEYIKNTVKQRKALLMYTMACLGVLFVCLLVLLVVIVIRSLKRGEKYKLLDNAGYKKKILSFGTSNEEMGKTEFYS